MSEEFINSLRALVRKRASIKTKITVSLKQINEESDASTGRAVHHNVSKFYKEVEIFDSQISELYLLYHKGDDPSEAHLKELSDQSIYALSISSHLDVLSRSDKTEAVPSNTGASNFELKLPVLTCGVFSGEGSDSLEYFTFISNFNNVIGNRPKLDKTTKFTYLKTYLRGYALKVVQHLRITDANYITALSLLEREFLNKDSLIDDLFIKLLNFSPKFDSTFLTTKIYINEIRCILSDLETYDTNLLNDDSSVKFVSHVVVSKLPMSFRQELARKLDNNYPTVPQLFDNYIEIIRTLNLKGPQQSKQLTCSKDSGAITKRVNSSSSNQSNRTESPTVTAASVEGKKVFTPTKTCKFCSGNGHGMFSCRKYNSHDTRLSRCTELKMCSLCTSFKHLKEQCPRKLNFLCHLCNTKEHVAAMCPKFVGVKEEPKVVLGLCMNSSTRGSEILLPTLTVQMSRGGKPTSVRCLVDSCSQRSYVSSTVMKRINSEFPETDARLLINTYTNSSYRNFAEAMVSVNLGDNNNTFNIPFYVDSKFDLKFDMVDMPVAAANISAKFELADSGFKDMKGDCVQLEGILGADALQFFKQFTRVDCMNGSAFSIPNGVLPFGNIDNFLTWPQICRKYDTSSPLSTSDNDVESSIVSSILNPINRYFDPIHDVIDHSLVEGNLEDLFKIESLGFTDDSVSDFDAQQIEQFQQGISFKDGHYHVKLPWYQDKIKDVKSNFCIAKAVLSRVVSDLTARNLMTLYDDVFTQQVSQGILCEIDLNSISVDEHIWIPHRPIIKTDQQTTTKIRPVLNCSLSVGKTPSLNQASYPGIDLLNSLLGLLLNIRSNKYLVISDISKAFLQIRLSSELDRKRFSILWQSPTGELKAFNYNTIVFGLASSPFILNYIIKHHLTKFENDECSQILSNNFYVDNLFITGCSTEHLAHLCEETRARMKLGGFDLCSWVTNNISLQTQFEHAKVNTNHQSNQEKLLGYLYSPATDELNLSPVPSVAVSAVTKRTVLSALSRTFDPLGLCTPVTVRGKLLLRKIWQSDYAWDDELCPELVKEWKLIETDLSKLSSISFPRRVADSTSNSSLMIFCDSSKDAYGFCSYGLTRFEDRLSCNLLFAKVKVAPVKTKTLPTLELLSIFLAFKCLHIQLSSDQLGIKNVIICSDSQVALSWVLTETVKSKNIFSNNRVKDILLMKRQATEKFKVGIQFKYIPTELNPSDLNTRGISFTKFESKLDFWIHGPPFLVTNEPWPHGNLGCMSEASKSLTLNSTISDKPVEPVIPVDKYSSLNKLIRVTSLLIRFIDLKCRKVDSSPLNCRDRAKLYWLKYVQQNYFQPELKFFHSSVASESVPPLVNNLNLFIDSVGLLRCKGRLSKCEHLTYDLQNPVLLPKDGFFTVLIVRDFHERCKHLGVNSTLNALRNNGFWLPKGRSVIKSVLSECIVCKKINSYSFRYPKRTDFIADKVNFAKPFDHTGIDYTGHFHVKFGDTVTKMYIIIFTCLNVRAVHLELVPSMTTHDFLLAFIKFTSFHCIPTSIYSDNANTFIQACKILNDSNVDDFSEYLLKNSIKHVRIPVYSAWVGTAWERLIRVVKSSIHKTVGRKQLEYFQLASLLADVQNAVNSRPLTYRDSDINNLEVVSPNSFLKLHPAKLMSFGNLDGSDLIIPNRKELISALSKREDLTEYFKHIWYDNYLLALRESSKDMYEDHWVNSVKVDDVVLINAPTKPRPFWPLGRVSETLTGADGKTRCVRVTRPDKSEEVYPICNLYPLELSLLSSESSTEDVPPSDVVLRRQPTRAAAEKCKEKLKSSSK